jgi:hypothetical protein
MIKDPISKLYKHMSSKELALLAFANLANRDELEQARIIDAVPRHTYSCLDATFSEYLDRVFNMACCWSIQYWQCQARLMAANGCLLAHLKDKDDIQQWALDDEIRDHHARRLAAVEVALVELCQEHGIDIEAVKQIAGITTDFKSNIELDLSAPLTMSQKSVFKNSTEPDPSYLAQMKSDMLGVLKER